MDDGRFEGVSYLFNRISGRRKFKIDVSAVGGCASKVSSICINDACSTITRDADFFTILAEDATSIKIVSPTDNLCYVSEKDIYFQ